MNLIYKYTKGDLVECWFGSGPPFTGHVSKVCPDRITVKRDKSCDKYWVLNSVEWVPATGNKINKVLNDIDTADAAAYYHAITGEI